MPFKAIALDQAIVANAQQQYWIALLTIGPSAIKE
jgi:hypothetical protein